MTDDNQNLSNIEDKSGSHKPKWISTKALYNGFVEFTREGHLLHHWEMSHSTMQYIVENTDDIPSNAENLYGRAVEYEDKLEFRIVKMVSNEGQEIMAFKVSNPDDMLTDDK
ncbi:MAG: hypothetical protein GC179_18380 [Anaerolineaceae bacterium]|nr:hypothetical protein [Anaerolineaceae bacterium]